MGKILCALICMLLLINPNHCQWTHYGNFTDQNISDFIAQKSYAFNLHSQHQLQVQQTPLYISNWLNTNWAPAWNVFFSEPTGSNDGTPVADSLAIVYGFAYNNHWGWKNHAETLHHQADFVLWKDYNCYNWVDFQWLGAAGTAGIIAASDDLGLSGILQTTYIFDQGVNPDTVDQAFQQNYVAGDAWLTAYQAVTALNSQIGHAWSAVIINNSQQFYGRFCNYYGTSNNFMFGNFRSTDPSCTWNYLVFRTRYQALS